MCSYYVHGKLQDPKAHLYALYALWQAACSSVRNAGGGAMLSVHCGCLRHIWITSTMSWRTCLVFLRYVSLAWLKSGNNACSCYLQAAVHALLVILHHLVAATGGVAKNTSADSSHHNVLYCRCLSCKLNWFVLNMIGQHLNESGLHVAQGRFQLTCSVCGQLWGACIQCAALRACYTAFHPLCARSAGLHMATLHDDFSSSDDDDSGGTGLEPNFAPNPAAHDMQLLEEPGKLCAQSKRRSKRRWREGTAVGEGARLVCHCARHTPAVPAEGVSRAATAPAPSGFLQPVWLEVSKEESSRCRPFNHALRRGHREPDVIAAALAKRRFVCVTPYLIGHGESSTCFGAAHTADSPSCMMSGLAFLTL